MMPKQICCSICGNPNFSVLVDGVGDCCIDSKVNISIKRDSHNKKFVKKQYTFKYFLK